MFKLSVAIAACLLCYTAQGKRTKHGWIKPEDEDHSPKPDVVSYSTFGVNDVGTYEGFVPTSPDFTKYLTGADESTTNSQPPSFPTSVDSSAYSNFAQGNFENPPLSASDNSNSQPGYMQFQQNFNGFFNTPFEPHADQPKNNPPEDFGSHKGELNSPIYGTKLGNRNKLRFGNNINHTEFDFNNDKNENKYNSYEDKYSINEDKYSINEAQSSFEPKPDQSELGNGFPKFSTYPSGATDFGKTPVDTQNPFKFQRVVDFTKMNYPPEMDTSLMPEIIPRPEKYESPASAVGGVPYKNMFSDSKHNTQYSPKEIYVKKSNNDESDNTAPSGKLSNKYNYITNTDDKQDYGWYDVKQSNDGKKKKNKPWAPSSNNFKEWKEPPTYNGYEYSTNVSNMSFKFGVNKPKKPFISGTDEIVPASSNNDYAQYQFPEVDYSKFKKIPSFKIHDENEFDGFPSFKEKNPFNEKPILSEFSKNKPLFTPETTGSYWGNSFKSPDISSFKNQANKLKFSDGSADDVVNIRPKRPKHNYGKQQESKLSEWSQFSRRPTKTNKPWIDFNNEVTNKFKSEEDLLGLRNHDTSLPSYLPNYHSNNNYDNDEVDYKKLVDKWRQSYLKSKYKDSLRDYETYASEAKPVHVPVPKPYPIEVAHPVIVPVPQPYPVRVPVAKPVAVPFYREIVVPIEKPVPYPVYKKVPYPIEKLVPVQVEKEVAVPVSKPYPVHVPYIRPVFHQSKTRDEYDSDREEDDYFPRQESKKKTQYRNYKPKYSTRDRERPVERERNTERLRPSDRPRRPSRTTYHDRNRKSWPDMRSTRSHTLEIGRRPTPFKRRPIHDYERDYY